MIGLPAFIHPPSSSFFLLPSSPLPLRRGKHSSSIFLGPPSLAGSCGLMEMGNSGIGIITAITISGCSLLFLAFLKNVYTDSSREEPKNENPTPKRSVSAGKKKVRFSVDVEEPSRNNEEYRRRRGGQKASVQKQRDEKLLARREKRSVELADNRSALYSGIYQYRSQMSTLMLYGC